MQFDQRTRREFITLLGGAAGAWPLAAQAQQAGMIPRVGYIRAGTPNNDQVREEFMRGMRDLGYVEGRNITYEFRYYGDDVESIPSLIDDLLRAKVDVIVAGGAPAIRAAQTATQNIPIVIGAVSDPLSIGLIAGLASPGGNTTGLSILSTELTVKRLELLREVMPQAVRIAILQQPANPGAACQCHRRAGANRQRDCRGAVNRPAAGSECVAAALGCACGYRRCRSGARLRKSRP